MADEVQYAKDPLLSISIALAALGAVQASTGMLSELARFITLTRGRKEIA